MSDRYFVDSPITSDRALLSGQEAHHLIHVMRAKAGNPVVLFDGSGREFEAVVDRVGRSDVELSIRSSREVNRELPVDLTLGVALPKGDRQKWLIEKAVEVGVRRVVPLETARGVSQPVESALERLRRGVIEASKQCGRNRLLEIAEPRSWADFVTDMNDSPVRLVAHPATEDGSAQCVAGLSQPFDRAALAVGPEGGFTDEEIALAVASGWRPVTLGQRILRIETAAIALSVLAGAAGKFL